jgi:hypothetical protein
VTRPNFITFLHTPFAKKTLSADAKQIRWQDFAQQLNKNKNLKQNYIIPFFYQKKRTKAFENQVHFFE